MWKSISNEPNKNEYQSEATEIHDDKTQNKKRSITKNSPKHTLHRKRKNISVEYRDTSFEDFRLMILDPTPKNG